MNWTAGYASDIEYITGFYREQSPAWLNFVCLLNGGEPLDLCQPYSYCELGFGRGLTAELLAAGNPHAQFYAADFNPAHVAGAARMAAAAQLHNLTLLENSFEELASGATELPHFDFITLHGIYTWVTAENRQHIVDFINRHLKPGGLVYVSYNAMPGWTAALPLQRLLVEHADLHPGRNDAQLKAGAEFVKQLEQAQAAYLTQNPALKTRLTSLANASPNYLVHEYLHKHWQPLYHADVARDLARAKMSYAGSAELSMNFPPLYLSEERRALLEQVADPDMRETLKDYFLNSAFRKDVFVRGATRVSTLRQTELLGQVGAVLTVPRARASTKMKLHIGEMTGHADLYGAVLDALGTRPHTLAELAKLPPLASQSMQSVAQIVALLTASNQAEFYFPAGSSGHDPATRLNRALAAQTRYGDDYAALCAPLLGNGLAAPYLERMFYLALVDQPQQQTAMSLALRAWEIMSPTGRRMQRDGTVLQTPEDNLQELKHQAEVFLADRLPVWRQLGII
ncbi:class I SAM-dependent methyltransferase [Duganella guangzhouensis]|nr:class I SAM-dependent methyltransferase [Duganella guangzhouensis]